ncbi:hypothetical protein IKS_03423 [Bacillus cereus VDM062]|nr:hypothetical protein IKS_03423 [Bacillus cereus VDM062]
MFEALFNQSSKKYVKINEELNFKKLQNEIENLNKSML